MKCTNCGNEQAVGKFCGKCGTTMQELTATVETTATVEHQGPQPVPASSVAPAQPNEHVERVKETSKMYIAYAKDFVVNPSKIFGEYDRQFVNGLITISLILLLSSFTIFTAIKSMYDSTIGAMGGFFGFEAAKLPFWPIYSKVFFAFLIILGVSLLVTFVIAKLTKQTITIKQSVALYGTLLLPALGLVLLSFIFILLGSMKAGLVLLGFAFLLATLVYPIRLVFHDFGGASKIDLTHRGVLYVIGFSIVMYAIVTPYVKSLMANVENLINLF